MIGAIIGDIVGSRFEWNNNRSKDFELLNHHCFFTDDSVMSLAVCAALLAAGTASSKLSQFAIEKMRELGNACYYYTGNRAKNQEKPSNFTAFL